MCSVFDRLPQDRILLLLQQSACISSTIYTSRPLRPIRKNSANRGNSIVPMAGAIERSESARAKPVQTPAAFILGHSWASVFLFVIPAISLVHMLLQDPLSSHYPIISFSSPSSPSFTTPIYHTSLPQLPLHPNITSSNPPSWHLPVSNPITCAAPAISMTMLTTIAPTRAAPHHHHRSFEDQPPRHARRHERCRRPKAGSGGHERV